jgi:hypothetical protein
MTGGAVVCMDIEQVIVMAGYAIDQNAKIGRCAYTAGFIMRSVGKQDDGAGLCRCPTVAELFVVLAEISVAADTGVIRS